MDKIDHLLKLLDFEIERLKSEDKQPGWTIWALLGSLATIIWLLLKQFPQNDLSWLNIFTLLLFISISVDIIKFLYKLCLVPKETSPIEPRFGYTKTIFSSARALCFLDSLQIIALLVILNFTSMPKLYSFPIWLWYGSLAVMNFIGFILSFRRIPFPLSTDLKPRFKDIIVIILLGLPTLGLFGLAKELFVNNPLPTICECRIAGLLFAIMTLTRLLARTQQQSHLFPILLNLRRDLILENLDIESAKQQIDIALTGLRVDHIFQEDVSEILGYINEGNMAYQCVSKELKLLEEILSHAQAHTAKEDDATVVKALQNSIECNLTRADAAHKNTKTAAEKIGRRFRFLESANPTIHNDLKSIQEKISCAVEPIDSLLNEIRLQAEKIRSKCGMTNMINSKNTNNDEPSF